MPRKNATELLKLAPGILLTNEGGEGHAEQVFLRGFDAREGQDIEFSVGGVPINESGNLHGNGYADTHFIIPELVAVAARRRGPVRSAAGQLRGRRQRRLRARPRAARAHGQVHARQLRHRSACSCSSGPRDESTHTFGGGELYKTDGFGQNRDAERGSAMGQYEGRARRRAARSGSPRRPTPTSYHSAGVLREDDYPRGRIGFYDTYDSRARAGTRRASRSRATSRRKSGDVDFRPAAVRHLPRHAPARELHRLPARRAGAAPDACTRSAATCSIST